MPRTYTSDQLDQAVSAVRKKQLSILKASREFSIPRTTLHEHVNNVHQREQKGPKKQLTKEETDGLVNFALHMARQGFPMTRERLRAYVKEIVTSSGRPVLFNLDTGPSDEWFRKLERDYPDIAFRKPERIDRARSRMSNEKVIDEFFVAWADQLKTLNLSDKPAQVFNCDETGWCNKEASKIRVLAPKMGHIQQQNMITADHVTAHLCIAADGKFLPPMIIYKNSFPHRNFKDGVPGAWLFSTTETGYMTTEIFLEWFSKCFLTNCGRARPVVLIMDNHDSHVSLPLIETARKNDVHLFGFPSHTTHILQPLDVHMNGPLKMKVLSIASNLGFAKPGTTIGKSRLPVVLSHAIDQIPASTVKEAFRRSGVMPCNKDAIDRSQLIPPSFKVTPKSKDVIDEAPIKTCESCGHFLGQNPLVTMGVIPASLADVFVPPPVQPKSHKKPNARMVTTARVISGDEMLEALKEKERLAVVKREEVERRKKETEEKKVRKQKEAEERKERREVVKKERELKRKQDEEERSAKRAKKELDRKRKEDVKATRKLNAAEIVAASYICAVCSGRGNMNDELNGISWFGCDDEACGRWYHDICLSISEQLNVRESLEGVEEWKCKLCSPSNYEE